MITLTQCGGLVENLRDQITGFHAAPLSIRNPDTLDIHCQPDLSSGGEELCRGSAKVAGSPVSFSPALAFSPPCALRLNDMFGLRWGLAALALLVAGIYWEMSRCGVSLWSGTMGSVEAGRGFGLYDVQLILFNALPDNAF